MLIDIVRDTAISGEPVATGERVDVAGDVARMLMQCGKAVPAREQEIKKPEPEPEAEAAPEAAPEAKPKRKRRAK